MNADDAQQKDAGGPSELAEWVNSYLGIPGSAPSVCEANMRLAVGAMKALNRMENRLGEEDLTASLLGSLVAALPLSVLAYGPAEAPGATLGWAKYAKSGDSPFSEAKKGADFALLITLGDGRARVAIFQAKSDASTSATRNKIKLSQSKEVAGKQRFQVEVLREYASDVMLSGAPNLSGSAKVTWVHYLAQLEMGLRCVSMDELSDYVDKFLASNGSGTYAVTEAKSADFIDVIEDGFAQDPKHWLELDLTKAGGLLPDLIKLNELATLMDLVVADDGKGQWKNIPDAWGIVREPVREVTAPEIPFKNPQPLPKDGFTSKGPSHM